MSKLPRKAFFAATVFVIAIAALAQQTSIRLPADNPVAQLKSGAGEELARKDCGFCHSTDYIVTQPHLTAEKWEAEVQKMIQVYGAPIGPNDAKIIFDFLAANYAESPTRAGFGRVRVEAGGNASPAKSESARENESAGH